MSAPSATARVKATSSSLGAGSPLGWLCTRMKELAASRSTMRNGSRGDTWRPWIPPAATRRAARSPWRPSSPSTQSSLVIEDGQTRPRPCFDRRAVWEPRPSIERRGERCPAPELHRGHEACSLGHTHACPLRELADASTRQAPGRLPCSSSTAAASKFRLAVPLQPVPRTMATSSASPRALHTDFDGALTRARPCLRHAHGKGPSISVPTSRRRIPRVDGHRSRPRSLCACPATDHSLSRRPLA